MHVLLAIFVFGLVVLTVIVALVACSIAFFVRLLRWMIGRGSGSVRRAPARRAMAMPAASPWARCPRVQCRTDNPVHAQFCRRCGAMLATNPAFGRCAMPNGYAGRRAV